jgi:hypothetical protein
MNIDSLTITSLIAFAIAFGGFMQARVIRACIAKPATVNSQSEKTH